MSATDINDNLYFRQLLSGRDFAVGDPLASQMVNYAYLIGDRHARECVIVDPAYAVSDLLDIAAADGMKVVGALASHYHPDHIGGSMMGYSIEGITALLAQVDVPIHVNEHEAHGVTKVTGVTADHLVTHSAGDVISVGSVCITCIHTPGHTPGSQCFLVDSALVSGDTLFLEGCGRTDLPGSDASKMYESLQTLSSLPDDTIVFPGHAYSAPNAARMDDVKQHNYVFKPKSYEEWMAWFGGAG